MLKAIVADHCKVLVVASVALALGSACGSIEEYSKLRTPTGRTLRAGVGQAVFRINKMRDLPNLWGRADLWGRKVDTGWQELRYLGLADDATAIFAFGEQDVYSNETTMSRAGLAPIAVTRTGNTITGVVPVRPSTTTEVLAPSDISFTHNFRERPVLEHSGVRIRILDATPSGLSYSLEQER